MGGFFKAIGKAIWRAVRSKKFREIAVPIIVDVVNKKVKEDQG